MNVEAIERLMTRLGRDRKVIEGCEAFEGAKYPFLVRYTLAHIGKSRLYLHVFLRSDAGTDLHCHPWNFVSLILSGGYMEVTQAGRRRKRPGMLLFRRATWAHRVELLPECPEGNAGCLICSGTELSRERPSVSLVWRSDYLRQWGFFTPRGWIPWKQYFTEMGCDDFAQTQKAGKDTDIHG
jgi:hypothetical protein